MTLRIGDFNGHVGKKLNGFESIHGGNKIGEKNLKGRLEFRDQKNLCVANTWFKKKKKRKTTYCSGVNEIEIDFVLVKKESRKFLKKCQDDSLGTATQVSGC